MELWSAGERVVRRPPAPNGPAVEVLFGGDPGGPDVAVVRVEVPPGAGIPEHDHGGSDVVLVPLDGAVEITKAGESIVVTVGDAALIRKHERVALRNPADHTARLIVAAAPVAFVAAVRAWPERSSGSAETLSR